MSDALAEALRWLIRASEDYHRTTSDYFSDTEYDRNGCLANDDAALVVDAIPQARAALASYDAAKGPAVSDDFAAGMRRAADILWNYANDFSDDRYQTLNAAYDWLVQSIPAKIDAALTPPAATAWTPPEDRGNGFVCLGWCGVEWLHVLWIDGNWRWVSWEGDIVAPTAFAPLPSALAQKGEAT